MDINMPVMDGFEATNHILELSSLNRIEEEEESHDASS